MCGVLLSLRLGRFETRTGNRREINNIGGRCVKRAASGFERDRALAGSFLRSL